MRAAGLSPIGSEKKCYFFSDLRLLRVQTIVLGPGPNVELVFKKILNVVYCSQMLLLFTLFRGAKPTVLGQKWA